MRREESIHLLIGTTARREMPRPHGWKVNMQARGVLFMRIPSSNWSSSASDSREAQLKYQVGSFAEAIHGR